MRTITIATAIFALCAAGTACGNKDAKKDDAKVAAKDKAKDGKDKAKDAAAKDKAKAEAAKKAEAEKAAKKAEPGAAPEMPKFAMAVRHEVEDFAKWKKAFDAHEAARKESGALAHTINQDAENPNIVYVWMAANDVEGLKKFATSEGLKTAMKDSGVKGEPRVIYFENVSMEADPSVKPEETLPGAYIIHKVADFAKWKAEYDKHADKRKEAGLLVNGVSKNVDDEKEVGVWAAARDLEAVKKFMGSEDLKNAMKAAGVEGEPEVFFLKPAERKMYGGPAAAVAQK